METDALAYHLAELSSETFSNGTQQIFNQIVQLIMLFTNVCGSKSYFCHETAAKNKLKKPTRAPIRMLPNPGTLIPAYEDIVKLDDEMPEKEPKWFSSVRGRRNDHANVHIIYL